MPITIHKPTSAGRRISSANAFAEITVAKPLKSLTVSTRRISGRNNQGKITVRHRGGAAKRRYRMVDFKQSILEIPAKVQTVEYDPHRSAWIALIAYANGVKSYILAPQDLKVGQTVVASKSRVDLVPGNRMPIDKIPVGTMIYNVELNPGQGGLIVRSAGNGAQIVAVEGKFATLRLPSKEVRKVPKEAMASVGMVSNPDNRLVRYGKAGRMRHLGFRPTVRGKAMNPVDHPHGGGEGHNPIGMKNPKTPWGKPALGVKTRKPTKHSWRLIVSRRPRK
ncbi:MAG: 50S ribosomal protein L2 [Parcubacteria group bacterium]|nr:50S ribosomal protein L2 [Parcubacteria group bacterium]